MRRTLSKVQRELNGLTLSKRYSPRMTQGLFARVSLVRINTDEMRDEVFGRVRDLIPVWAVELEVSFHDLGE